MSSTNFVNGITLTDAGWFNDVDALAYEGTFPSGPTTLAVTGVTSLTAFAGITGILTLGGTGASSVVAFPGTLDATSSTAAGVKTAGGWAVAKAIFGGTTLNIAGASTLTGLVTVGGDAVASPELYINGTDGTDKLLRLRSASVTKWNLYSAATSHDFVLGSASVQVLTATQAGAVTIPGTLALTATATPTGTGAGAVGQIAWDTSYLYICTATNDWRRVALADF